MATIQAVNNGDSGLAARTKINNNDANINAALAAAEALLITDNPNLDDFQKITDEIEAIQATLSVNDANYDTLQEITDKLKAAETKLASIATGAEVNVQSNWDETDNTSDAFIQNKPTFGDISEKNVGTAIGNIQENGAVLGNSQTVETDSTGKFITAAKNTAYNANFGTGNADVARGDASYLKVDTYTKPEANALLVVKQDIAAKGQASGYASLDSNAQVPLSQLPANAKSSKVVADITARNAIASTDRFEGLRVHVLNATADGTVTSGSAGYILKSGLANTDWEKTYESESLDIDLTDYFNKTTDTTDDITQGTAKFTTQADIDKLATIATGATANSTDATLLNRANHTGTQTLSTISDSGALAAKNTIATNDIDNNAITTAKIQQFASKSVVGRTSAGTGDVEEIDIATTLKSDLSLDNVANVDTTTTANIADSLDKRYVTDSEKTVLSNTSGANTGDETTTSIQTKRPLKTIENQSLEGSGNIDLTSTDVGLGNVDNTSDADKPVSTAQQTALDGKLAKASNLSDVTNRQTALNNITNVASATNEYILTKDTTTGNAIFKPAPGGSGGTNLSIGTTTSTTVDINSDTGNNATIPAATTSVAGLLIASDKTKLDATSGTNSGDEVAATESVAGIGEIVTQTEAEAGTDNTNKFLNALRNKQAFDAFISAHEAQKILSTRIQPNEISYNSDIAVETPISQTSQGSSSITYSSGSYTVSKDCILQISATISFRNNGSASTDPCTIEVRDAASGIPFGTFVTLAANPSNLVNSQQNLLQSITPVVISLSNGDSIQIYIKGVNLTQFITNAVVTIIEI